MMNHVKLSRVIYIVKKLKSGYKLLVNDIINLDNYLQ